MANIWDDAKGVFGKWATKAADKAGEFTRDAADKAEEVTRLGKVKLDIFQLKREKEKIFQDLGEVVFDLLKDEKSDIKKNEKVNSLIEQIHEIDRQLEEKENKYESIRKKEEVSPEQEKSETAESTKEDK